MTFIRKIDVLIQHVALFVIGAIVLGGLTSTPLLAEEKHAKAAIDTGWLFDPGTFKGIDTILVSRDFGPSTTIFPPHKYTPDEARDLYKNPRPDPIFLTVTDIFSK